MNFNKIKEAFDILYKLYISNGYELNYEIRYLNRVHLSYDGDDTLEITLNDYFADGSNEEIVIRNNNNYSLYNSNYEQFFNILKNIKINKVIKTPVENPIKDYKYE